MGGVQDRVTISAIFGPVIQGEGPLIGRPTVFVRTGGCDNRCEWCDTKYAVEPSTDWKQMDAADVFGAVRELMPRPGLITLSGGNPALQRGLSPVVTRLGLHGYEIACETQGTIAAQWFSDLHYLILSPKPPSSRQRTSIEALKKCLNLAPGRDVVSLKFVVADHEDYIYARRMVCNLERSGAFSGETYLQVCNRGGDLMADWRWLAELVVTDGWLFGVSVLPQLHVLAYGNERRR